MKKYLHFSIWVTGTLLIGWPDFGLTVGLFHGGDGSLLMTSTYGAAINAFIFYQHTNVWLPNLQQHRTLSAYLNKLLKYFIGLTLIETLLDCLFFGGFYNERITSDIIEEAVISNTLMHLFFFLMPSYLYRFTIDWISGNQKIQADPKSQFLAVKSGASIYQIPLKKLQWIESDGNYIAYHYEGKRVLERKSLSKVMDELPQNQFMRCHRSYIISLEHLTKVDYDFAHIGTIKIPIGRVYRNAIQATLQSS